MFILSKLYQFIHFFSVKLWPRFNKNKGSKLAHCGKLNKIAQLN